LDTSGIFLLADYLFFILLLRF